MGRGCVTGLPSRYVLRLPGATIQPDGEEHGEGEEDLSARALSACWYCFCSRVLCGVRREPVVVFTGDVPKGFAADRSNSCVLQSLASATRRRTRKGSTSIRSPRCIARSPVGGVATRPNGYGMLLAQLAAAAAAAASRARPPRSASGPTITCTPSGAAADADATRQKKPDFRNSGASF